MAIEELRTKGIRDESELEAMWKVPRHLSWMMVLP